jgi:hypothetical protein
MLDETHFFLWSRKYPLYPYDGLRDGLITLRLQNDQKNNGLGIWNEVQHLDVVIE